VNQTAAAEVQFSRNGFQSNRQIALSSGVVELEGIDRLI